MKIVGIIAEYNPFHNGHAYQIRKIREELGADYIIIAMSGDFVQRGEPAIVDKYVRTQMALSCGADLVVELPALWAVSSAEAFAKAGVMLFEQMGCVDTLCFGAETNDLALLDQIADLLVEEPVSYKEALSAGLRSGKNFPSARISALKECFGARIDDVLSTPNNILAIEYLKALKTCHSSIRPYAILRNGAGYHDTDITLPNASATAIRAMLKSPLTGQSDGNSYRNAMPPEAFSIFSGYLNEYTYMDMDDFSAVLSYLLLTQSADMLSSYADCTKEIANRLKKNLFSFTTALQFASDNKSRDITYTRMCRILIHMLLQITKEDIRSANDCGMVPYIRPLGFCKSSAPVLSELKKHAAIPVIGKLANAAKLLSPEALAVLEKDIFAADLYEQTLAHKKRTTPRSEYTREIVLF